MNILSLGAGVQSSTLAFMALHGEIQIDAAIFADTQAEPQAVYDYLDYIEEAVNGAYPIYRVSQGSLKADILATIGPLGQRIGRVANPPFFVLNTETQQGRAADSGGTLWRGCTKEYKLQPLRRKVRELWEASGRPHIYQIIGISLDECQRMKDSGARYITNTYPLVERRITRQGCLQWLQDHGYRIPPKSACYFCPYTNNHRWKRMKEEDAETWEKAVEFDANLRTGKLPGVIGDAYVHRSFKPLAEAILTDGDTGQSRMEFGEECEGMCGV